MFRFLKKNGFLFLVFAVFVFALCGCRTELEEDDPDLNKEITMSIIKQLALPEEGEQIAVMKTNYGEIKIKFFPSQAPKAVENFVTHAQEGYYDGLIFHRVMNDFMIQGGDPTGTGFYGESIWGTTFEDEFSDELHNFRGALSMANSGANTNGSQFFIVQKGPATFAEANAYLSRGYIKSQTVADAYVKNGGTPWLDGHHTVFGQVFEGMDVVDSIAAVRTNAKDKPLEDVVIEKIEITEYHK